MRTAKQVPGLTLLHQRAVERIDPAEVVHPGDDARVSPFPDLPEGRGQGQVEVKAERIVNDQRIELGQRRLQPPLDGRLQRRKARRNVSATEPVANGAHFRVLRVELGNDDQLDACSRRKRTTAPGQDRAGVASFGEPRRLLIKDRFDPTYGGRARVVQEPNARRCSQTVNSLMSGGGSSRITARWSGFSMTSTCGRPPL